MKREKTYWVVARNPGQNYRCVLMSHYKPHYIKTQNEWRSVTGDEDWCIVPVWVVGDVFVEKEYYEPRKVTISTEFFEKIEK